ncbi:flagellar biosynthetic protein FliR [Salipiger mucosus]|uniref:Flagellar biosynthesis protein FliR n=1 Tax=Salipiger mucosus DSM 16094 TaxID=1123237 RepID=S9QEK8_9RHOB|nr:flagellar biosynthetic protein FliR [Salipiger mucosus]EPX78003.1 Flagellar biosynthesis protein FliR [Salipiger mucosus DSM 16094]
MDLAGYISGYLTGYFLVLARIGCIIMFMPGFGESYIPSRAKIMFASALSLALMPATPVGPTESDDYILLVTLLAAEVTIGIWIGVMSRTVMSALQFAGFQVGQVSALANAFATNSGPFAGSTMIATFLTVAGVALLFITNTHHLMIQSMIFSYEVFPLGGVMLGDMADQAAYITTRSMYIGFSLAAPFYILGLMNNVALGLANKMMPTLPVFFVASSILITTGLFLFGIASPFMLKGFFEQFVSWTTTLSFVGE